MQFIVVLASIIYIAHTSCPCSDFVESQSCNAYRECVWDDNSCVKQKCAQITTASKCLQPDCFWNISQCESAYCPLLSGNDCTEYPGCRLDLGQCKVFEKCEEILKVDYCYGRTKQELNCHWDKALNLCHSFEKCENLSVESCGYFQQFGCQITDNKCITEDNDDFCELIQYETDCNKYQASKLCLWDGADKKCKHYDCDDLKQSQCIYQCAWTGKNCLNCSDDPNNSLMLSLISLVLMVFI